MNTEQNSTAPKTKLTLAEVDKQWQTATDEWKQKVVSSLISQFPSLDPFSSVILHAFTVLGADPKKSNFLKVLIDISKVSSTWSSDMVKNVNTLVSLVQQGKVDVSEKNWKSPLTLFFYSKSMFDRPQKEFIYSATVADIVSNPSKRSYYFQRVPKDFVDNFFDSRNDVKPAGGSSDPYNEDTIYGTIEKLAGKDHSNTKKDDKRLGYNRKNNENSN